jgi:hypothetical protein
MGATSKERLRDHVMGATSKERLRDHVMVANGCATM